MRASFNIAGMFCVSALLILEGCDGMARSWHLKGYDHDIESGTHAIESARDNVHRAAAYSERGSAYSEKARYCKAFKLISADEYGRLFGLAVKDHEQAIALDPGSAEAYFNRGQTYYSRAALEAVVNGSLVGTQPERKAWFEPAVADFKKATEKDARHYMAWDMLGLSHETIGELDEAIDDYTHEMALNSLGKTRLADAYCTRGNAYETAKKNAAAIADYEKSIEAGAHSDGCSCDPYNPLFVLYDEGQYYEKSWAVVHRALNSGKWIAPELLIKLKKDSGRDK